MSDASAGSQAHGQVRVVLVTAPDTRVADRLATALVEERLAACVNLVSNVQSIYRWEGSVQRDPEVLLVIKTASDRLAAMTERVEALHPYDVPEVVALPVASGSSPYLDWVMRESRP